MDAKKVYFDSQKNDVSADGYLDSSKLADGFIRIGIACGYVDTTEILFTKENILARVTAAGAVDFFDEEKNLVASVSVPAGSSGRGCYQDLTCKAENGKLLLRFPEYSWTDHYPDCDGESDRWSARITGYKAPVVFDLVTHTATVEEA